MGCGWIHTAFACLRVTDDIHVIDDPAAATVALEPMRS